MIASIGMRWRVASTLVAAWALASGLPAESGHAAGPDGNGAREILIDRCLACHGPDRPKGDLNLSTRATALAGGTSGAAIVPGKPDESYLFERVEAGEMPPKRPLTPDQVATVRAWIERGSPIEGEPLAARKAGPDWWSLRPIRRPALPKVQGSAWVRTPVDAFIKEGLERAGLDPSPEADRTAYIRRVTFDLTGLPPTPEEIDAFQADRSESAYERLADRLLASPAYGERWARHWLDVARFAESHGYETNQLRPNAWPYRDYVIRAFNRDLPFAEFVRDQLAGDADPAGDWLSRSATGFLVGGAHDVVGNQTVAGMRQQRADDLDDMIATTATAFLGLTVQCARCHDHKFDPIRQSDYYGLQAVFAGVQHADREVTAPDAERRQRESSAIARELARIDRELDDLEPEARPDLGAPGRPAVNPRRNVERFAPAVVRSVRFTVQATGDGIEPCIDELEVWTAGSDPRNVAREAKPSASSTYPNSEIHRLEHLNDGRVGNARSWISAVPGKGWVRLDWPGPVAIERVVWGRDREEKYKDRTPSAYYIEVADDSGAWHVVASSADRQAMDRAGPAAPANPGRDDLIRRQAALRRRLEALRPTIAVYAGTFNQPGPTHLLRRGDPMQPVEPVEPSAVAAIRPALNLPAAMPEADRRMALARWISDPDNPLPARVVVNRAWQGHFGRGLVATSGDFGFNGERPSHPELLDWLAAEYRANGGRLKPIHRLIVLSATYRQASRLHEQGAAVDRDDRLLWRFPPRRLEAEEVRDAILAVAGRLDRRMGGPGYSVWERNTNYVVVFRPRAELGPEHARRMIYEFHARSQPDPTFGAFDCPDGGLIVARRNNSTTPLQALNLLNSRFLLDQARTFADRLRREVSDDPEAEVRLAFRLAFGREPSPIERDAATEVIREHGAATLGRALLNANEFLYVP